MGRFDKDFDKDSDPNISYFPNKKTRKAMKKQKDNKYTPPSEPILNLPPVVKALCSINIAIFLFTYFFSNSIGSETLYNLSFVSARYFGKEPLGFSAIFSPITYMFLHAGWLHLGMNIAMLMAFGSGIEKNLGGKKMLIFYMATGLCGAIFHLLFYPDMLAPMIGASGAISGLFGGILIVMSKSGMMGSGNKNLIIFIFIWLGVSVFFGIFGMPGVANNIAWTVHIGGFLAGLALYKPIKNLKL